MPTGFIRIPPERRTDFACAIAGALAEAGIQQLDLTRGGTTTRLSARTTDLPARLVEGDAQLTASGVTIHLTADRVDWSIDDPALAEALTRATDLLL